MQLRISARSWAQHLLLALSVLPAASCGGSVSPGSGGSGGQSPGTVPGACEGPKPVVVGGVDTGYEVCANGLFHRRENKVCPSLLPRAGACQAELGDDLAECTSDAECTAKPHGLCARVEDFFVGYGCGCWYGCTQDSDCGTGQMCVCADPVGYCESSTCKSAADCGGNLCSEYETGEDECGYSSYVFACQSKADTCAVDDDCGAGKLCVFDGTTGVRSCGQWPQPTDECTEGRPFLVGGVARVAGVVPRADWNSPDLLAPSSAEHLTAAERAAIAAHWQRAGQMEHASIAAFARFVLHLLSRGAPPDLVLSAQAAIADETAHARMCFAISSAHAGEPRGPGRLAIEGSLDDHDARTILVTTFREGCIGETIAAIEAQEALEHATDPAVRAALSQIAADERRHALLAWRYVAWELSRDDGALRSLAAAELHAALAAAPAAAPDGHERLIGFGLLGDGRRAEIRRQTLLHAIAPVARELLGIEITGERPSVTERERAAITSDA